MSKITDELFRSINLPHQYWTPTQGLTTLPAGKRLLEILDTDMMKCVYMWGTNKNTHMYLPFYVRALALRKCEVRFIRVSEIACDFHDQSPKMFALGYPEPFLGVSGLPAKKFDGFEQITLERRLQALRDGGTILAMSGSVPWDRVALDDELKYAIGPEIHNLDK